MDIVFLDRRSSYDSYALQSGSMGGVQKGTILLAEALAKRGHIVTIYNDRSTEMQANGVFYAPIAKVQDSGDGKIVISNNSISIYELMKKSTKVLWARNNIVWSRIRRENSLFKLFKYRPNIVFPSKYTAQKTSLFFPFRSRTIIEHGIDDSFAKYAIKTTPPAPVAIFASQPQRNLKRVVKAWTAIIHPALPQAKLHIYYPKPELYPKHLQGMEHLGIEIKGSVSKETLAAAMHKARIMIYPGHRTETFCNVAAEAQCTGLPVVTMGIGALKERVRHNVDGLISWTISRMGHDALCLLTNDALWARMHRAAIEGARGKTWDARAMEWERAAERWQGDVNV